MFLAIKMTLDYSYRILKRLEFKCNHFNSIFLAKSQFKNRLKSFSDASSQKTTTLVSNTNFVGPSHLLRAAISITR